MAPNVVERVRMRDERADAQRRQPVRLGERPADDEIPWPVEQRADERASAEVGVRLVDEHERPRRRRRDSLDRAGGNGEPGRVVRIGQVDERVSAA